MPDVASPAGPMFGPDSLVIEVKDETGASFDVHVYPDARNTELRADGQPGRYHVQPTRMFLAQRKDSPELDFSMSAMVKRSASGLEYIGGSCTLTTTLALPDAVTAGAVKSLVNHDHPEPPARIAALFDGRGGDPTPSLRMIPVTRSAPSCTVVRPQTGTGPISISAQHGATGSVEAQGRNTFLVSCDPAAAEEIVTDLRNAAALSEAI